MYKPLLLVFIFLLSGISPCNAETIKVYSVSSLQQAINNCKPGDVILVANGTYPTTESILVGVKGTKEKPIVIKAETRGSVEITGAKGFTLSAGAQYINIEGFRFTHATGAAGIVAGATHCLITKNLFECKAPPDSKGTKPYFTVSGDDNEISYNTFQNKTDEGQMLSIQGPGGDRMAKRTWIHHNYFYNFPPKANNCSAIQIGLSGRSMDSAFCIVEYNLFIKCAGENEGAICNKACNNIYRFNTFGEGTEELSLRHGNKCEVYGNFFMGSTGLRFSGDDHMIYSNYFTGCKEAIVCTNGDGEVKEGSKLTCHDRPDRVSVIFNSLIGNRNNFRMPGRNNGLGATFITFSDNNISGGAPVSISGNYLNPAWKNNILWNTEGGDMPTSGFSNSKLQVSSDDYGMKRYGSIPPGLEPLDQKGAGADALGK